MSYAVAFFVLCVGTSFGFILATLFRASAETADPVDVYGDVPHVQRDDVRKSA